MRPVGRGWVVVVVGASALSVGFGRTAGAGTVDVTPTSPDTIVLRLDPRLAKSRASDPRAEIDRLQYQHRFADAERLLEASIAASPRDPKLRLQRAQLRIAQGNSRGALVDCLQAATGLDALTATGCEAQAIGALGQVGTARRQIETALARAPAGAASRGWAEGIAAELAARSGDDQRAETWYRSAMSRPDAGHFARVAYAEFLLKRQRPREVVALLSAAPDDASVMRLRRRALEQLGR